VQDNHCDCGLFVLTYLEYFVHAMPPALNREVVEKAGFKKEPDEGKCFGGGLRWGGDEKQGGHGVL
jgi:hypothetical protein